MSQEIFYEAVKSSLDYWGVDLARDISNTFGRDLYATNLDDTGNVEEMLASADPAIVWQLLLCREEPRDPLYAITFAIGAKTSEDVGASMVNELVSKMRVRFVKGSQHDLLDYSGATIGTRIEGVLFVTDVTVEPQEFETMSQLRMVSVSAACDRTL